MRIAVFTSRLHAPPRVGADLHTIQLSAALARRGHDVEFFTLAYHAEPDAEPILPVRVLSPVPPGAELTPRPNRLARWLIRRLGASEANVEAVRRAATSGRYEAVVCCGLRLSFAFRGIDGPALVWYLGDELVGHTLSLFQADAGWRAARELVARAATFALCERIHAPAADEIWVVAAKDRRWLGRVAGRRDARVIENGVDFERFRPAPVEPHPRRAVFWGALTFEPNVQAVEFFVERVWPQVRRRAPDAEFLLMGFTPSERVRKLAEAPGVTLKANVPDIRPEVCSAPVAVFPFVSGTGIKNKLLEGAAMERALVVSPVAVDGLVADGAPPWMLCREPREWADAIIRLWDAPDEARVRGRAAREWVVRRHSWDNAARLAEESLERAIVRRRARSEAGV